MKTKIVLLLAVVITTALRSQPVFATATYTYTGNPFTTVSGPYTTSDFVSGMVTLAGPLAPNMAFDFVSPTAFSFSDGVQTITDQTAAGNIIFAFETGPTGAITAWEVDIHAPTLRRILTEHQPMGGLTQDLGGQVFLPPLVGGNSDSPGTWVKTVSGVPDTGSTLSLMTLTLMALGVAASRFTRAAA
jgi:hypothetical protein